MICETALSLLLVAAAGLLLRSFAQILKVDPGFRPDGVLTLRVALPDAVYSKPEQVRGFYNELLERVQRLPGVRFAGAVSGLPLSGQGGSGTTTIDSQSVPMEDTTPEADQRVVSPDYFKAMGISLVRGRFFDARDSDTAPPVAIVDESLAQIYWPNQDPIGKRLHPGGRDSKAPWVTVVGVVRHVRNRTLEARSRVEVYWPENQRPSSGMTLAVLASGNPMNLAPTIQREVSAIDPDLPVYRVRTMTEVMGDSLQRRRLALILLAAFAGLALLLAGGWNLRRYVLWGRSGSAGDRFAHGPRSRSRPGDAHDDSARHGNHCGRDWPWHHPGALAHALDERPAVCCPGRPTRWRSAEPRFCLSAAALFAIIIPARRAAKLNPMVALRNE